MVIEGGETAIVLPAFDEAFLEFELESSGGEPSGYSEIFFTLGDPAASDDHEFWCLKLVPIGTERRTYQLPLNRFRLSCSMQIRELEWADLGGRELKTFRVGGNFSHQETLTVSNVRIRH